MYDGEISWYTSEFSDSDLRRLRLDVLRQAELERQQAIAAWLHLFDAFNKDVKWSRNHSTQGG